MAFPTLTAPETLDLRRAEPGQVSVPSLFNSFQYTIARGPGQWEVLVSFPILGVGDVAALRELNAFVDSLGGQLNSVDIPVLWGEERDLQATRMIDPADGSYYDVTATNQGAAADVSVWNFSRQEGFFAGDKVNINGQLYTFVNDLTSGSANLWPSRTQTGDDHPVEFLNPVLTSVRANSSPISIPKNGVFSGPLTIHFLESRQ